MDLREFDQFPATAEVAAQKDEFQSFAPEVTAVDDVLLRVTIHKSGQEYICHGTVQAHVKMECSRCLREFSTELNMPTEFIVRSDSQPAETIKGVFDDQDYVYMHGQNLMADPGEIVRQALVLSLDMKPLCAADCKGLCPRCGANLNDGACSCRLERIDDRWSALKSLRNNHT
ncbi:MAG: DUF177 domain-containing protein [Candidatus Zixiibacteriota bacterium]